MAIENVNADETVLLLQTEDLQTICIILTAGSSLDDLLRTLHAEKGTLTARLTSAAEADTFLTHVDAGMREWQKIPGFGG